MKTNFLKGDVFEELYMMQPDGYVETGQEHFVCKLRRTLYCIKQSARAWNIKINRVLLDQGFIRSEADQCLYVKFQQNKWT